MVSITRVGTREERRMQDDGQILRLVTQRKASRGRWQFLCQRIAVRILVTKWEIYPNLVTHMEIPCMHSVSARLLLPQPMYYQQSNKSPYLFQGSLVCRSLWGHKELVTTQRLNDNNTSHMCVYLLEISPPAPCPPHYISRNRNG